MKSIGTTIAGIMKTGAMIAGTKETWAETVVIAVIAEIAEIVVIVVIVVTEKGFNPYSTPA